MAYPVNSIADYVIEFINSSGKKINNLKLQKILYYLEARFLLEKRKSLFIEDIEKWRYGPVIPDVYYRFNHLGAENIERVPKFFDFKKLLGKDPFSDWTEKQDAVEFQAADREIIDDTIRSLIDYNPFILVDETHEHSSWLKDKERIYSGIRHIKYNRDEILQDFAENPNFKLW